MAGESYRIDFAPHSPGLFTLDAEGRAAALIAGSGQIAGPRGSGSRPVRRGETLEIFAAGLGAVAFPPPTGESATADPLSSTVAPVRVRIGERTLDALFAGLAPGFAGLYQVNVTVPHDAPASDLAPVVVIIGGIESNTAYIAVE